MAHKSTFFNSTKYSGGSKKIQLPSDVSPERAAGVRARAAARDHLGYMHFYHFLKKVRAHPPLPRFKIPYCAVCSLCNT